MIPSLVIISRVLPDCFPSDLTDTRRRGVSGLIIDGQWSSSYISHTRGWAQWTSSYVTPVGSGHNTHYSQVGRKSQIPTQPPLILPGRGIWCLAPAWKWKFMVPAQSLMAWVEAGSQFFWWNTRVIVWKFFCLARLFLSGSFGLRVQVFVGSIFLSTLIDHSRLPLLQLQVWNTWGKKKTQGTHHYVLPWIPRPLTCLPSFINFSLFYI